MRAKLALWGGIECTVSRVGDAYQDQIVRTGHQHRLADLDCLAQLGTKTLRYPILWERTAPYHPDQLDWRWSDERLSQLQALDIQPVVGLVHHGCGPRYASFDTEAFEKGFPVYAQRVAQRYPWVKMYVPVNEPLTTARFSGLYGLWYPHGQSEHIFVAILLRQLRATVRAMAQIRMVQPEAQLVQTDDLGYAHSTPGMHGQADFENARRWLSWDLLCGLVTPDHALWAHLLGAGATEAQLWFHVENPCPPSVVGVNYYVTSERYLKENRAAYGSQLPTTNGQSGYIDTEVVRAAPTQRLGLKTLLLQVWERYQLPIVVTEAHLGSTVDEQMRWLGEVWQQAQEAQLAGADVQAVTAWALLGMYDWHCLLTCQENRYEPGVYDVQTGRPQATGLVTMIQQLIAGKPVAALVPPGRGWWQKNQNMP